MQEAGQAIERDLTPDQKQRQSQSEAASDRRANDGLTGSVDPFEGLVVGRIVYYTPTEPESNEFHGDLGPFAAQVTAVHGSGVASLLVTLPMHDRDGREHRRKTSIAYNADGMRGYWAWPKRR